MHSNTDKKTLSETHLIAQPALTLIPQHRLTLFDHSNSSKMLLPLPTQSPYGKHVKVRPTQTIEGSAAAATEGCILRNS